MKFVIEQHTDGFLAYPLSLRGVVVGQGETRDAALLDAQSAARFHIETFGADMVAEESQPIDAEVVEAEVDS